jgi:RimJ/RimL family protein N-acetyltransferase
MSAINHDWHGRAHAIGIGIDGEIVAGMAVMNVDNRHGNAEIAMATSGPRWASRATVRKLLEYPFCQLGLRRITTIISAANEPALKLNRQLGFKQEGVMRHGMGDEDAIIMGLLREEAERWLQSPVDSARNATSTMAATAV